METFASVLAPAHLAGSSFATAEAVIDPFLAFDQAAFDQIHGPNSFVLEDFYVFTFSPNLSAPVPALSQWGRLAVILLAIVLGILALVRSQAPGRQRS